MGNPVFHSQYTAAQIEASLGKTPTVNYTTRTWLIWDIETSQYVDSGVSVDTDIMIDDTLSIPNAAADAKATGDELNYDEYLINEGAFTIPKSILESGLWNYSQKTAAPTRGRTKYLLPVRVGMVILYENTTYDVFFGVLATQTSESYAQTIGWRTNSNGHIAITCDGWLTFVFRNHADTSAVVDVDDFDSVVKITTAAQGLAFVNVDSMTSFGVADIPAQNYTYTQLSAQHEFVEKPSGISADAWVFIKKESVDRFKIVSRITVIDVLNEITYTATYREYIPDRFPALLWPWKKTLTSDDLGVVSNLSGVVSEISEQTSNLLDPAKLVGGSGVTVNFDKTKITVTSQEGTYKRAYLYLTLDASTSYTLSAIKRTISGASGIYYKESPDGGSTYPGDFSPLISYSDPDGTKNTATFTTTTGYVLIAFFCTDSTSEQGEAEFSNVMLCKGSVGQPFIPPLTAYDFIARENARPKLNVHTCSIFKRVLCVGDSYTEGWINTTGTGHAYKDYSWPKYMEHITGNEWINCGVSGATSLTWLSNARGLASAQSAGVVQAYIVMLMINDALTDSVELPVGTIEDVGTENPTTYYGAYSKVIRELHAISEDAIIFVCTCPYFSTIPAGYQQAVRDIAALYASDYNVHLLDMKADEYLFKGESLTGDYINYHYTALGYEQFAEIYEYYISGYINTHIADFQGVYLLPYDTTISNI